jgi:hypothetical protein
VRAGIGAGADVAALLGRRGQAVLAGALGRPPQDHAAPLAEAAPSLAPSWDGGHLLRAFRIARWRQLFDPWFSRDHAHARPQGRLDPSWLQGQALDLLLAGDHWAALLGAARTAPTAPPPRLSDSDDPLDWLPVLSAYAR